VVLLRKSIPQSHALNSAVYHGVMSAMYKNIVILGAAALLISSVGAFLVSWVNHDRYNPVRFIEAEIQECSTVSDCSLFFAYCGNNIQLPIAAKNERRYEGLRENHCKANPPKTIVDFAEENKSLACIKNVCSFK